MTEAWSVGNLDYDAAADQEFIRSQIDRMVRLLLTFHENVGVLLDEELVPWMEWFDAVTEVAAEQMTKNGIHVLPIEENEA